MLCNPCYSRSGFCGSGVYHGPFQPCNGTGNSKPPQGACLSGSCFNEYASLMQVDIGVNYSNNYPTKEARTITVFIKNTGEAPIVASLQNSPNGFDFTQDAQQLELQADQIGYLVPYIFSKYTRVAINGNQPGTALLWFQFQNYACNLPCESPCQPVFPDIR